MNFFHDIFRNEQIGRALVSTHDYTRAVHYYRKALRGQPNSIPLRHDLARLCLKLGRFNDATGVLKEVRKMLGLCKREEENACTVI